MRLAAQGRQVVVSLLLVMKLDCAGKPHQLSCSGALSLPGLRRLPCRSLDGGRRGGWNTEGGALGPLEARRKLELCVPPGAMDSARSAGGGWPVWPPDELLENSILPQKGA